MGERHRVFVFRGAGCNFIGVQRAESYVASVERMLGLASSEVPFEVNLPNHPGKFLDLTSELANRLPGQPHPMVDPAGVQAWLHELREAGAQKLREERAKGR